MAIKGGFDANDIAAQILSALDAVEDTGVKKAEDIGVSIGQAVRDGIVEGSKGLESEIGKTYKQFQNFVRSMNRSADGLKLDKWKKGLGLAESLMKDEKYARRVADALKDVQATFNGTKVSGLENVLKEFAKNSKALQGVSVPQVKSSGTKASNKPKVETPVVQADPVPIVKAEEKKLEAIENTTAAIVKQGEAIEKVVKQVPKMESIIKRYNKLMHELGLRHLTIGEQLSEDTNGWGLNEMVKEAKFQLDRMLHFDGEQPDESWSKEATKRWKSETGKLQRFIAAYEPYADVITTTVGDVQQATTVTEKQTEALQKQASAAESAAQAQEKLNKAQKQSALSGKEVEHALDVKAKYTGAKLQGKSDFISAIKDEWGRGNKAVSAKLFEQYKARFPGGTYDPSTDKSFGADWADNYNKYLEQANRHIAELDKRLGGVVGGVVEIQGEFKKLSEIIAESKNAALSGIDLNNSKFIQTDKYDYTDSDITDMKTHIESVRKEADQLKDEALAAKQAFDEVSNIRSEYFGVSLRRKTGWNNKTKSEYDAGKKSDWQSAIKSAWDQGNKPLAAKLYEQYQANFPKGSFDPSKQARFGEDWVNNYAKYLEQANRHIVELDTMLRNMGAEYGKYIAYFELDSFANENATRLERIKQEGKLVGEVVRSDLDSRKEVAHNKYATGDQVIAQENLNKAVAEYNRRQAVANDLLEFRNEMIEALDDDSKEYLFEGYKTPADAIQDASGKYSDARLDADRFAITELEEAIRVARELGIEIDEAYTVPDDKKNKIVNDILMRQRRFVMNNAKAGTPEKSQQIWDAAITQQNEYQQELAETEQAVERVSAAESNIIYHAGDLSNPSKTQKTYPLGNVRPSKDGVVFSGFTGLYTTEDVGEFWGNEWSGAPISTIDASQYKLFDASSDAVASAVKVFFDNLNGTIYGYVDDFTTGAAKRLTDVKTVDELWADFNEIFKSANIGFETFEAFIKRAQGLVYGKNFMEIYDLPDIDEGIVKTGEDNVLQGASKEVFNSDSFQTQLLKMLGFEGIDLRGTKFNGTYTGGTVIFDVKPESIQTTNEKWSDVMARNGYRVDEVALEREEKRRQLAFDTAKAYSQQADEMHQIATKSSEVPVAPITEPDTVKEEVIESVGNKPVEVPIEPVVEPSAVIAEIVPETPVEIPIEPVVEPGSIKEEIVPEKAIEAPIKPIDKNARLEAVRSEMDAAKSRGSSLSKEVSGLTKELVSVLGYGRTDYIKNLVNTDLDHWKKLNDAYNEVSAIADENQNPEDMLKESLRVAYDTYEGKDNILKALMQICRFPEKYGGVLSAKQAVEHFSDDRLFGNAVVPLGNGYNIAFGSATKPAFTDSYYRHYSLHSQFAPSVSLNGEHIGLQHEPFRDFSKYNEEFNSIFGLGISKEKLMEFPIVQQALHDTEEQLNDDKILYNILHDKNPGGFDSRDLKKLSEIIPVLEKIHNVRQQMVAENDNYRRLVEEANTLEQEIKENVVEKSSEAPVTPIVEPSIAKEEVVHNDNVISDEIEKQPEIIETIHENAESAKLEVEDLNKEIQETANESTVQSDNTTLFDGLDGQLALFEDMSSDANKAEESVESLNEEIQKIEELDGKISLFDKQDEKVIDTSNIPDDFRMVSVSPESTSPQIAVHDLNDIAGMNSTEEAYDQLIEGENKYQQELEETDRIKKERDGQVEAFSYAAVPFIGDDEYKAVSNDDKIKLFESFVNKIEEDGMSASDAMDQLYLSMEALRKQSEAMPDDVGVDYSAEIQKLEAHVNNLGEEFKNSEQYRDNFNMLVDGIKSGSISAAQAMDKMSDAYEKWNIELIGNEQSDDKDLLDIVANKNDPRVAKAFKNMDIKKWIKGNVKKDAREELEGELYKLAQTLVDDNSEAYNAQLSHIAEFIVANFKSRESKEENPYNKVFEDLIVPYTDKDKAEMGEQLFEKAKRILGNKFQKRSEKNKHVDAIDQLVDSIAGSSQRSMFDDPEGYESHYNKFDEMLDKFDEWKQEGKRKTKDTYLSDSDVPGIIENFNETMRDQMVANIEEQQAILDAKTEAAQAATDSLNKAFQNVKSASSSAVLKGRTKEDFEDFARQIANDSGMELGTVAVSRDEMNQMRLATIKLINKELAQSITYTYDIQENIEGVNEAFLRSTYAVGDVNKALENAKNKEAKMLQAQLSALKTEESAYGKINTNVRSIGEDNLGDGFKQKIASYESSLRDLRAAMDALKADPVDASGNLHKAFDDAALKAKNARVEIDGILKESQKLDRVMANMEVFDKEKLDPSELKNLQQAMLSFASSVEDGVFKFKGFNKAGTEMYGTLEQSSGAIKNVTVALKQSSDQLFMYGTNANRADNEWEEFKNTLASGTKNLVGMYVGFQEGVQAIRSGVEAVKQIDLAMTELKKVTDETDDSYKEFLEDTGRTSAVIGSTVSDFAEASATFARLGYSLDEASSMAETAIVYKNVADGLDTVEEASDSIISTMMAFGIEASDTMGIIDRFNAVGNNFAITSAGIGDALQRSASALYSAGNTIDESVALVTAANSVIQNPEQVGKCLPTIK